MEMIRDRAPGPKAALELEDDARAVRQAILKLPANERELVRRDRDVCPPRRRTA